MKNKSKVLLLLLSICVIHLPLKSQDIGDIKKKLDALLPENYSSTKMEVKATIELDTVNVNHYALIVDKDLLVQVYEFQENFENNCKRILSEDRKYLLDFAKSEFSTYKVYQDNETGVSVSIISDLPDKQHYTLLSIFLKDDLLYSFTLLTTKKTVFDNAKKIYARLFMID